MSLRELLNIVKKNIKLFFVFPLLFALVSAVVCWGFLPDEYSTKIAFYVLSSKDKQNNNINNNEFSELSFGINFSQQLCNDVVELIKSNNIQNGIKEDLKTENIDDIKQDIKSSEKNRVINITLTSSSPDRVTDAGNSITNRTVDLAKQVSEADSINVIDYPEYPNEPSGPPRLLFTTIAFFVGLFVASVIVFIKDVLDTKIKGREDLLLHFDIPVLSQFPKV